MQVARGDVKYSDRYKQEVDFSGLKFERNITPTDIDGVLDFGGSVFVLIELKFKNAEMPNGQRWCLERVCDKLAEGSRCVLIVANHDHPPEEKVNAASAVIREYRLNGSWMKPQNSTTLRQGIDQFKAWASRRPALAGKVIPVSFVEAPDTSPRVQAELPI